MSSLALQPATPPPDAPFPPDSPAALINLVAAYLQIQGLENLEGVIVDSATPAAGDRGKLWVKTEPSSGRTLGLFTYVSGEWTQIPVVLPSGEEEPASPKVGELFVNTAKNAVVIFNGTAWTTNLTHQGDTASRPVDVPANYLYFDTTIQRELRWTGSAWTTRDGAVGDVKMVDAVNEEAALTANPGWVVFETMRGRFPIASVVDELNPQSEGGQQLSELKVKWSAKGRSAEGGARESSASFIAALTISGSEARADGTKMAGLTDIGTEKTINLTPPYKVLVFLRKDF